MQNIKFSFSQRLKRLPPYLFLEIDRAKRKVKEAGGDIIDFGVGDPDLPTPSYLIRKLSQEIKDPSTHHYALDQGIPELRQAITDWYRRRFKVILDPEREILPLIGSKEGIVHFPLAFLDRGKYSLIPDPCYPPYRSATILAGGKIFNLPLLKENNFLPDLKRIPRSILRKAKLIFVNYPNNPTASTASIEFYKNLIDFAHRYRIIVISDLAYSEISYDGYSSPSILQIEGAKDCSVEFHSFSKTYNMTGWRIGWVCGNAYLIEGLAKIKSNIDSGIFTAIQRVGVAALNNLDKHIKYICKVYQERRDILARGLDSLGFKFNIPKATFYFWVKVDPHWNSINFSRLLLEKLNIVVTPGIGFGKYGEGYIRLALTLPKEKILLAVERLKKYFK
ncbi:MAG: LL-diaminopimelate aminotransferase [Candidatus Omnitrophica bacterium]|nr:LL-diaminopimelate aminotransferase [Candidatus Omnitrophota bacterium]